MPIKFVGQYFCVSKEFWYLVSKTFKQKRREASRFCRNFFYLTGPKKLRQGTILCFRKFLLGKNFMDKRGGITIFRRKFLSHCTKIFHWRTLWRFRKILLSKIFMHRRGGITVLSKFFVSQDRNEKLCKGTLLFSRKFLVSKKKLWIRGAYHDFQPKFLCLTLSKNFVKKSYCFLKNFWFRQVLLMKNGGGGITFFRRKFFVSQCRKTS